MSLQTYRSQADEQAVIDLINQLNNAGVPVYVAAGNSGPNYNTLSTYAKFTPHSVGNIIDPYEGGWGIATGSSRGTSFAPTGENQGPKMVAPGEYIRAAQANSTNNNGYVTLSGTSMATPAVAGTYALMKDAAITAGRTQLTFVLDDYGTTGNDKVYGNGNLLSYDSIKTSGGKTTGSFNDYREHIWDNDVLQEGWSTTYRINVTGTTAYFSTTLLIANEQGQDLDLYVWEPGQNPDVDPPAYASTGTTPQERISFTPTMTGIYTVKVVAFSGTAGYSIDFVGQISQ